MADAVLQKKDDSALDNAEVTRGVTYTPRVDIVETEDELRLFADLPGVREGDVDIRFENGELTLTARRQRPQVAGGILWENELGDFFRVFRITEAVDAAKIWAELKLGVLTLHLPKVEAVKPRKIAVKAG